MYRYRDRCVYTCVCACNHIPPPPPPATPTDTYIHNQGASAEAVQLQVYAPAEQAEVAKSFLQEGVWTSKGRTKIDELSPYLRQCGRDKRFTLVHLLLAPADPASRLTHIGNDAAYRALIASLTSGERALYILLRNPPFPSPVPPEAEAQAARETLQLYLVPPGLLKRVRGRMTGCVCVCD